MLEHYYDINKKNKFEELFGDLYIGKNMSKSIYLSGINIEVYLKM